MAKPRALHYTAGLVREIAERFGEDVAVKFSRTFGGRELVVPRGVRRGSIFAREMGDGVARWLQQRYGGEKIYIPLDVVSAYNATARLVDALLLAGHSSIKDIARCIKCSDRTVRRRLRHIRELLDSDTPDHIKSRKAAPAQPRSTGLRRSPERKRP